MKLLLAALALMCTADAARILAFFPLAVKSHHNVFRPILEGLGKKGHDVVYFTGQPYESGKIPPGITQVDLSSYIPNLQTQVNMMALVSNTIFGFSIQEHHSLFAIAHYILGSSPVQQLIHSQQKFDAVLMVSSIVQEYASAFVHKFGAVGVEISTIGDSSWVNELAGLPDNTAYQLDFKAEHTQNMDFWQRLYNTYATSVSVALDYYYLLESQRLMDQYFNYTGWDSRPPIGQLLSNRSLILSNSHPAVGYPVPLPPHRVEIGGVNVKPTKSLPKDIQTYMDESEAGVIYFSLGSNINVSDPANKNIHQAFMKVFQEQPQRVLMKWETQYPGELPKNVKVGKWFPQQDILAHKKCVLFITHGGYLSLTEAVHFGVPLVGIPFFADQVKNLHFVEEAGIGKMLRLSEISYQTVSKAVKEVLSNKSYKEEVLKRSRIFRDRRHSPVEEAVYWIEYVIKYPNVLTPKGASLSFVQLHLLDVWMFVVLVLCLLVLVLWKLCAAVVSLCKRTRTPTGKKDKKS